MPQPSEHVCGRACTRTHIHLGTCSAHSSQHFIQPPERGPCVQSDTLLSGFHAPGRPWSSVGTDVCTLASLELSFPGWEGRSYLPTSHELGLGWGVWGWVGAGRGAGAAGE